MAVVVLMLGRNCISRAPNMSSHIRSGYDGRSGVLCMVNFRGRTEVAKRFCQCIQGTAQVKTTTISIAEKMTASW
jgi:hypothetical protein